MFPVKRLVVRTTKLVLPVMRPMSAHPPSTAAIVDVTMDNEGIATLRLQRPPVNSLNLDLLQEISKSLDEVAKNNSKGMILTSALPTVYSAGLDIMELYKPDIKRVDVLWTTLQEVWLKLFGAKFITAAAINGHAPAGGCMLGLSCEYRVMVDGKFTIGLNEPILGIVAPFWLMDAMYHTIGAREAEFALTSGRLFAVDEALKVGLIDDKATNKSDAVDKCKQFIQRFDRLPSFARASTKLKVREEALERLQQNRKKDLDTFLGFLTKAETQEAVGMYVENLKKKAAK